MSTKDVTELSMNRSLLCLIILLVTPLSYSKKISITFDDAPLAGSHLMSGEDKTQKIIKHLKENNVPDSLFFVTTGNITSKSDNQRLNSYSSAGFHLAHHSHTHLSASKVEASSYLNDFDTAHLILNQFNNVLKYHRHPYLHYGETASKRTRIESHLKNKGYDFGYVTVDNFDWYINSKLLSAKEQGLEVNYDKLGELYVDTLWEGIQFYDSLAQKNLNRDVKHVLLLHENEVAALFLGKLIEHIRSKGWEVITPQEAYSDPISDTYDAKSFKFNKQGRVASFLESKGIDKSKLRHNSENTDFLDKRFEEYQVFIK